MKRTGYGWAKIRGAYRLSRRGRLRPQRKGFPVGGDAHAAKDEWRRRLEQGAAAVLPFRFWADDSHAVCAERKDRKCCRVGERIVDNSIFAAQMPYVSLVFCFVDSIGNMVEEFFVLGRSEFGEILVFDVCERIRVVRRMEFDDECANGHFDLCESIHCHKSEMAVEGVYVPDGSKRGLGAVAVAVRISERCKISGETIVPYGVKEMNEGGFVRYKSTRNKQISKLFVAPWLFREHNRVCHSSSPSKKMPAATIGRSLSGGVTGRYCTKLPCVAQEGRARKTSA